MASSMASQTSYTTTEETEIAKWTADAARPESPAFLDALEAHLASRSTILGTKPSTADATVYAAVAPLVKAWTPEQRSGENGRPNIVRLVDFVQNARDVFGLEVKDEDKVAVDAEDVRYVKPVVDLKAGKEKQRKGKDGAAVGDGGKQSTLVDRTREKVRDAKDKAVEKVVEAKDTVAAATTGDKPAKGKKETAPKQKQKTPAPAAAPLSPCLIDLRVGHILKAVKHPEADSLYVSTIAMGDAPGTDDTEEHEGQACRTVCSGLNGLVPLEEMQGRRVVVVANLKPVKMRGIKSCAMVLAASPRIAEGEADDHKGPVELVAPPEGAPAGERVFFEGWAGEPEGVLNPKKKIWETMQPGFTTTEALEVAFDAGVVGELGKQGVGKLVTASGGVCTVPSLRGAVVR